MLERGADGGKAYTTEEQRQSVHSSPNFHLSKQVS